MPLPRQPGRQRIGNASACSCGLAGKVRTLGVLACALPWVHLTERESAVALNPRSTASQFDPAVPRLFDQYVHGDIDRRRFQQGAARFAAGSAGAAGLQATLTPEFAAAQQVKPDDLGVRSHAWRTSTGVRVSGSSAKAPPSPQTSACQHKMPSSENCLKRWVQQGESTRWLSWSSR